MGGYGSGSHPTVYQYRVEDSLTLDVNYLLRNRWRTGGMLSWSRCGKKIAAIGYKLNVAENFVRLYYTWNQIERIDYEVQLTFILRYFGGGQYFFLCPECGGRAMKLYKSPPSKYFHCRTCQHLTYQSCRESHRWDKLYARWAAKWKLPAQAVKDVFKKYA